MKFDPNETIVMYDLGSSNPQSGLQSFLIDCNTGKTMYIPPSVLNKKNSPISFVKIIITISLNLVDFGSTGELLV